MREKELRIALVCYGGVSLAIYMHGVTKEVWKLARASRAFHAGSGELAPDGVEIEAAGFYSLDALPTLPGPISIAHHLIRAGIAEVDGKLTKR